MEKEHITWLPVREFPEHYEVNDLGQLRRKPDACYNWRNRIRKPCFDKKGYVVYIISVFQKAYLRYAHRLVADAFLGPIPHGMQVNHKDGNKGNPTLGNLEIVSNSENRKHSYRVLNVRPNASHGDRSGKAKLTWTDVSKIRSLHSEGMICADISRMFGISKTNVGRIIHNNAWKEEFRPPEPSRD